MILAALPEGGARLVLVLVLWGFVVVALSGCGRWLDHRWDVTLRRPDSQDRASHARLMAELRRHDRDTE